MTLESDLRVGDFFVSSSGFGGGIKDNFLAKVVQWVTNSAVNHAGIYIGNGQVVEAQPGGARYADVNLYLGDNSFWSNGAFIPEEEGSVRSEIAKLAVETVGTPYGWLDIVAIGLAQTRLGNKIDLTTPWDDQPWWAKQLMRKDRLICSQLVDEVYRKAGLHLFDDGRLPQLVSPGDLHRLILRTA